MKTYSVLFAEDVPHYATEEVEAVNDVVAIEAAINFDRSTLFYDPEWEYAVCKRIVHIEDEDGNIIAENIPVDDFILRRGGETERRLCDAAQDMLLALRACVDRLETLDDAEEATDADMAALVLAKAAILKAEDAP